MHSSEGWQTLDPHDVLYARTKINNKLVGVAKGHSSPAFQSSSPVHRLQTPKSTESTYPTIIDLLHFYKLESPGISPHKYAKVSLLNYVARVGSTHAR